MQVDILQGSQDTETHTCETDSSMFCIRVFLITAFSSSDIGLHRTTQTSIKVYEAIIFQFPDLTLEPQVSSTGPLHFLC